jgi:type I restriction enzyme S subunit
VTGGWTTCSLADICEIRSSLVDPRDGLHLDLPHVGAGNIESGTGRLQAIQSARDEELISGKFLFDDSVVLYSKIRPYLMKVARPDFSGLCSADIYPLAAKPGRADRDFLFYLLLTDSFTEYAIRGSARAGMPKVNRDHLFAYRTSTPPLAEQRRIVAILDEAFEGIATAKANAEKNLQSACEVRDTFLDTQFFPQSNWITGPLSAFVESVSTGPFGSVLHKSDYVADGVPLVNPINIVDGGIVPTNEKQVDTATAARLQSYLLRSGDIVVGRRGEIGRCAVVSDAQEGWLCGTGCFFIRPSSRVEPSFMAHLIRSPRYRARLAALSTGATMPNLSNGALSGLEVVLPDLAEQKRLLAEIDALSAQTDLLLEVYQRKLAVLDELKQSLLHQAFSGKL